MSTPNPKYFCPRCRAAYDADHLYCGRCGADMHRASRLNLARIEAASEQGSDSSATLPAPIVAGAGQGTLPAEGSSLDRRNADPWLGRVIDGRYRVIDTIGRGGMGVVYKVTHERMGKIAAMKVLHRDLADDKEVIQRFHREAEAVSRLTHPNTVQIFDFGVGQGQPYLVMEYVRGLDLGSLLDRDGPMAFARAAPLFAQICVALAEAHELGIVHRDLKPENVLVTRTHGGDDYVKVLDFGLAKLTEREENAAVTSRGTIVGTPYYMAPEQIRGEDVDARTDLYSLGALMYRVLTGEAPFTAKTPVGVLTKHLTELLVPPSVRVPALGIAPEVDEIIVRSMAKKPEDRFATAMQLLEALEHTHEMLQDSATSSTRGLLKRSRRLGQLPARRAESYDEVPVPAVSERVLRRADLDDFERSLKRRRALGLVTLPILLCASGAAAYYWWVWRDGQPRTVEVEPNDEPAHATLIAPGGAVTGQLGKRINASEGDRDVFRLSRRPAPAGDALSARVSGLPNIDVELLIYDRAGQLVARANEGGVGQAERIHDLELDQPVLLMIEEVRTEAARMPIENVSDFYELTVELGPLKASRAGEPDDTPSDATLLRPGDAIESYLDRRDDVDLFRFEGAQGRYRLVVTAPAGLPLRWSWQGATSVDGAAFELGDGAILRVERTDRGLHHDQILPAVDQLYVVALTHVP